MALAAVKTVTHSHPLKLVPDLGVTTHALAGETRRRRGRVTRRDTDAEKDPGTTQATVVSFTADVQNKCIGFGVKECHDRLACRWPLCSRAASSSFGRERRSSWIIRQPGAHFSVPRGLPVRTIAGDEPRAFAPAMPSGRPGDRWRGAMKASDDIARHKSHRVNI